MNLIDEEGLKIGIQTKQQGTKDHESWSNDEPLKEQQNAY